MNYFEELNGINVSDKIEKKNGLSYLSWSFAWGELKKRFPTAQYKVYEREDGCNYFTDGRTCWVKVSVTVPVHREYLVERDEYEYTYLEHIEYLPVMDYKNRSIPLESVTSMDVNKAIQRALTKAIARHGLGLYVYAGEDLPENPVYICGNCGLPIDGADGASAEAIAKATKAKYGKCLCKACIDKQNEARKMIEQLPITEVHDGE